MPSMQATQTAGQRNPGTAAIAAHHAPRAPREAGVKIRPLAVKKPLRQASSADGGDLLGLVSILCFP